MNHPYRASLSNALVASLQSSQQTVNQRLASLQAEHALESTPGKPAIAGRSPGMGQGSMTEQTIQNLALSLGLNPLRMDTRSQPTPNDLAYAIIPNEETFYATGPVDTVSTVMSKAGASVLIVEHDGQSLSPPELDEMLTKRTLQGVDLGGTVVLVNVTLRPGQSLEEAGLPASALEATRLEPVLDSTDLALKDLLASRRETSSETIVARQSTPKVN